MPLYLDEEAVDSRLLTSPAARRYAAIRSPYNIVSNFQRAVSPPRALGEERNSRRQSKKRASHVAIYCCVCSIGLPMSGEGRSSMRHIRTIVMGMAVGLAALSAPAAAQTVVGGGGVWAACAAEYAANNSLSGRPYAWLYEEGYEYCARRGEAAENDDSLGPIAGYCSGGGSCYSVPPGRLQPSR
jgi:hypothetical protein